MKTKSIVCGLGRTFIGSGEGDASGVHFSALEIVETKERMESAPENAKPSVILVFPDEYCIDVFQQQLENCRHLMREHKRRG